MLAMIDGQHGKRGIDARGSHALAGEMRERKDASTQNSSGGAQIRSGTGLFADWA